MIAVDQTTFGKGVGNCFAACVASVLEMKLEDVPFFMDAEDWQEAVFSWCRENNIELDFSSEFPSPAGEYVIVGGRGPRLHGHGVVMQDNVLVHDPHPDRSGLVDIWWWMSMKKNT